MSLAARRSTRRREDFVIRLGCLLVSFAVLASLVLEPPRAKAFAVTSSAVTALAGGFLSACGLTPVVSGMGSSQEVNESLARLIQEYLDMELPGTPLTDWLGDLGNLSLVHDREWMLLLPTQTTAALGLFASWVAGKYGTKAGENQVYSNTEGLYSFYAEELFTFSDGKAQAVFDYPKNFTVTPLYGLKIDKRYSFAVRATLERGVYEFRFFPTAEFPSNSECAVLYSYSSCSEPVLWENLGSRWIRIDASGISPEVFTIYLTFYLDTALSFSSSLSFPFDSTKSWIKRLDKEESSFALDVSDTMQQVLDRLTALEEGQSIALDVGATQTMEIQEILQGILDAILAGNLDATAEIVDTAEVPVDPPAGELPDVDGLGLPALGAALTSRFPFSIPWDVYKGVTLLAAPPKAPYFEVDFMAPIADRVGGWQGSTKIVLDFSEYEIIGQVCRWTSTIGFCLMLATGTKRLIWTA